MGKGTFSVLSVTFLFIFLVCGGAFSQEKLWNELNMKVQQLLKEGRYTEEGLMIARQAFEVAEKTFGPEHPTTALSINNLAFLYKKQDRYSDAEPLYKRALEIREKALGPEHPDTATSLNNLAALYHAQGKYSDAEPLYRRALAIDEKALGPNHLNTAMDLNNLAALYQAQGKYSDAEQLYKSSTAIREKALGPEHPVTAQSLDSLALLYDKQGRYLDAEPLYKRALAIYEKTRGPEHPGTVSSLNNLAFLYFKQGRYIDAEALCKRALAIREKVLGPEHPDTASSLNSLALFYNGQGSYADAEALFKRALAIREKMLGPNHTFTATTLDNLALLYKNQGRYSDAEPLFKRALAINEKALGPNNPATATSLDSLAGLYKAQGRYGEAEPLYRRAMAIYEKELGPNHPYTATSFNNLAGLYRAQGKFRDAESLYKRALAVYEKALGPEHPFTATSLNSLAYLYDTQGKYSDAEPLYKSALAIREKVLGPEHPDTATSLNTLACLLVATGREADALPLMQRAISINDHTIRDVFTAATEKEKFQFLATVQWNYEMFMNLILQKLKEKPEAVTAGLDAALKRKGIVLEALSQERSALMQSEKPEVKALYSKLQELTSLISSLTVAGPGNTSIDDYRRKLKSLESEREGLEKELTTSNGAYALKKRSITADCAMLAEKLPPGSALVEYLCISIFDFKATGNKRKWGGNRYFAYVLKSSRDSGGSPGGSAAPQLLDLGEASAIDDEVKEFRAEMARARTLWESGILNEAAAEKTLTEKGRRLYDLVISPIKKAFGGRTTLFLAPDAGLNLIPFGALQDETGKYLAEKYSLYYLSCGRDLLRFEEKAGNNGETVIVANPDFDVTASERAASANRLTGKDDVAATHRVTRSADLTVSEWRPLPGTRIEAEAIVKVLQGEKIREYQGRSALEETMKSIHSPRRLHVATHGFFLEDREQFSLQESDMPASSSVSSGQAQAPALMRIENPLLRSGIVLAGANRLGREKLQEGCDDGILTALEISGLPLRGTDLVVLSACDTGIGKVHKGEGVFGLGRAFHLAGARTVVMSLWSVPDQETQELMTGFYQRLKKGEGKASALQGASLAMIKERREKSGAAHPFFWASFICVGEP